MYISPRDSVLYPVYTDKWNFPICPYFLQIQLKNISQNTNRAECDLCPKQITRPEGSGCLDPKPNANNKTYSAPNQNSQYKRWYFCILDLPESTLTPFMKYHQIQAKQHRHFKKKKRQSQILSTYYMRMYVNHDYEINEREIERGDLELRCSAARPRW